jgi:hypothetical protein
MTLYVFRSDFGTTLGTTAAYALRDSIHGRVWDTRITYEATSFAGGVF